MLSNHTFFASLKARSRRCFGDSFLSFGSEGDDDGRCGCAFGFRGDSTASFRLVIGF
jgi:hypothetical protein